MNFEKNNHDVVCFGEVLWDILPSGSEPGGAPMNVAYHLHKQSKNPAVITRIGMDKEGKKLLDIFSAFGVCTDYFQVDENMETGKAVAKPNEYNEVVYDIVQPVAYDFIEWQDKLAKLVSAAPYFVYGSLAARNDESKSTLLRLLEKAKTKVLDINLRAPHYNRRIVEELLEHADFLKLNLAELELITGWFSNHTSIEDRLISLRGQFNINQIVVTMGDKGAIYLNDEKIYHYQGYTVDVIDTIGSGDAFLAALLSKLIDRAPPEEVLQFACSIGAFVASCKGACPEYDLTMVNERIKAKSNSTLISNNINIYLCEKL
jgi:fructokinase